MDVSDQDEKVDQGRTKHGRSRAYRQLGGDLKLDVSERSEAAEERRESGPVPAALVSVRFCFDICAKGTLLADTNEIVYTDADAERIRATGAGCHLEAGMLARALQQLDPPHGSMGMIENVGNLVCPALLDLDEKAKVVILSVTEGEDKPIKYPHMFPHLRFDVARCIGYARQVNPAIEALQVSAEAGAGMPAWYAWLGEHAGAPVAAGAVP